jgi:serine/threonine protein kinase/tetratricopeptide (TPR) repeat protein
MGSEANRSAARLRAVEEIFHAALERELPEVAAFLDAECAGDESLRREVEELLASHRDSGTFIATPLVELDARIFENEPMDPLIGQTIGHYEILKRIGSGGMGVVYLARRADQQYEKLVAIKLIKRGMDTDAVLRHFHNERQILASLDHPNIARLMDGDSTQGGLPYFVMEYVEGLPVDEYCDTRALSITERLQLFRDVCAAVSYAHRRAVIHRDLKPSNILVSADGMLKLLDFGIARILQPGGGLEPAATMIGLRVMTPEYASPEQMRGDAATTVSDVYSLGVVLYRLLTGRLPVRGVSEKTATSPADSATEPRRPSAVITDTDAAGRPDGANAEFPSRTRDGNPERLRRRLRGDLDNIALMALRSEPERRYQSVEQLSEDVRRHLSSLPVLARKDTLAYRCAKFVRRNAAVTAAAVLVLLTLVGGIAATTWQAHKARTQEALAKAEKARAERRFNDVRQLAHAVLFEYHDAIKDLPGATAVRERLVKDGLAYLDSLAREASADPALQRELAAAYERLGDVRGQAFSASLGDPGGAMQSYLKALQIRKALVASSPGDVQSRRDLARSYVRIGDQLIEVGEATRGMEYLRKGRAVYLELVAEQPSSAEIRYDLAAAYNSLGSALEEWGDATGALDNHRKALALRAEFVLAEPRNHTHQRNLSITHINLGRALVLGGQVQAGLQSNQQGLAIAGALLAGNPDNASFRRLLAVSYQNDGDYRAILHDTRGALDSFRQKLRLDEQSLTDDPVNAQSRGDLGYTCLRIGTLLALSGDYAEARSHYGKSLALYASLAANSPQDVYLRYRVIQSRAGIGEMNAKLGERVAALAESSKAMALLDETAESPTNSPQSSLRAQVYMQVAETHEALANSRNAAPAVQQEHWRAARALYVRSLGIWQDMQRRGILTGEDATRPADVAREIAQCDASLRKLPDPQA